MIDAVGVRPGLALEARSEVGEDAMNAGERLRPILRQLRTSALEAWGVARVTAERGEEES